MADKVGKTVIRLMDWETVLKSDDGSVDLRMTFSSSLREVIRPFLRVQFLEIMDSPSSGTYQTFLTEWVEDEGEDCRWTVP